jgi:hypothetical protein
MRNLSLLAIKFVPYEPWIKQDLLISKQDRNNVNPEGFVLHHERHLFPLRAHSIKILDIKSIESESVVFVYLFRRGWCGVVGLQSNHPDRYLATWRASRREGYLESTSYLRVFYTMECGAYSIGTCVCACFWWEAIKSVMNVDQRGAALTEVAKRDQKPAMRKVNQAKGLDCAVTSL